MTIPGDSVTGNNKIWRQFTFSPITTRKLRLLTNAAPDGVSRITEIEAYGPAESAGAGGVNWLITDHLGTPRMILDQTANPTAHNLGNTSSVFTSWTRDPIIAAGFAGSGGVVLFKNIERSRTVPSPDFFREKEVLVMGVVTGAAVTKMP